MSVWRASRSLRGLGSLHSSGFVFPELLAVLGILGILVLVAMPRLVLPDTLNASAFARQLATDIRLTRQMAISRRVTYALEFSPAGPPYTSYTIRNESTGLDEPDFPKQVPAGLTVNGDDSPLMFRFTSGGWGPYEKDWDGNDGWATITAGSDTVTVSVYWYNGRVELKGP